VAACPFSSATCIPRGTRNAPSPVRSIWKFSSTPNPKTRRPSAETLLHVQVYRHFPEVRVVLHPHSVNATLLSRLHSRHVLLQDYELLKAFPGVDTHACEVVVPNFANDQDIGRLAEEVAAYMESNAPVYGYLIAGHGFYTWGETVDDALRHVEAFEFLFECELRLRGLQQP
jgi:methylthioribulose-1-phosphate dehydratase